jgi:MoaA/NifB/PqqE/SkfB family radical SAM enzyme
MLDANYDCNLRCVYCHSGRSGEIVDMQDLWCFLEENVISVNRDFQVGCGMEPTIDPRLGDIMLMIARSRARPMRRLRMQTNGTRLKAVDLGKLMEAGLGELKVSVDSADPAINSALRGGINLARVESDIKWFHKACPSVELSFITTVTARNLDGIPELLEFGINAGATGFVLRELFYYPQNKVVDHANMAGLLLPDGAFSQMKDRISERFGGRVTNLLFQDVATQRAIGEKIRRDSLW